MESEIMESNLLNPKFIESQISEFMDLVKTRNENEPEFLQAVQSIGYGASEAIFERFTTIPILKRGQNLIKNMGKESMLSYKNAMKQYIKQNSLH